MLYPEAFAMAVASNSRAAMAARCLPVAELNSPRAGVGTGESGAAPSPLG